MSIPAELNNYLESSLSVSITGIRPVIGGNINSVYYLQTSAKQYLLKVNNGVKFPGMFKCEAEGLATIAKTHTIAVPEVVLEGEVDDDSFLLLNWIDSRTQTFKASEIMGERLANLHRTTASFFGFEADNYMGSLRQSNWKHDNWTCFFIQERLSPMVKLGVENGLLSQTDDHAFEMLYKNIPGLFNEEPSALIHGDLWSGNYIIAMDETPYLIDPAVSYSHRECDIALSKLFGGFSKEFYLAYHNTFPLTKGWERRCDLWNLYPLLVHLNLFGSGYLVKVRDCLKQFV